MAPEVAELAVGVSGEDLAAVAAKEFDGGFGGVGSGFGGSGHAGFGFGYGSDGSVFFFWD